MEGSSVDGEGGQSGGRWIWLKEQGTERKMKMNRSNLKFWGFFWQIFFYDFFWYGFGRGDFEEEKKTYNTLILC